MFVLIFPSISQKKISVSLKNNAKIILYFIHSSNHSPSMQKINVVHPIISFNSQNLFLSNFIHSWHPLPLSLFLLYIWYAQSLICRNIGAILSFFFFLSSFWLLTKMKIKLYSFLAFITILAFLLFVCLLLLKSDDSSVEFLLVYIISSNTYFHVL